jgi:hypothetical protein
MVPALDLSVQLRYNTVQNIIGHYYHMSKASYLGRTSSFFFFLGFMLSKLQYLPFSAFSATFRMISLGFYLGAYATWFLASFFQDGHFKKENRWYGFAKIKEQHLLASLLGFVATVLSLAAIFTPILFIPAAWIFLAGNVIWTISEYHKLKNPPHSNEDFSYMRQRAYVMYSMTTTTIGLVTAVAASLMLVFPLASVPITVFSLFICVGLGFYAFEKWLDSSLGDHEPIIKRGSFNVMTNELGPSCSNDKKNSPEPKPDHQKGLFHSSKLSCQSSSNLSEKEDEEDYRHCSQSPL